MEFGIEKCALLIRENVKSQITEGIELPIQDRIILFGETENEEYLEILKSEHN